MDVASSMGENNFDEFERYYYKKVTGEIWVGEKRRRFGFEIPNYYRLVRYVVRVGVVERESVGKNERGGEENEREKHKEKQKEKEMGVEGAEEEGGIWVEVEDRDY